MFTYLLKITVLVFFASIIAVGGTILSQYSITVSERLSPAMSLCDIGELPDIVDAGRPKQQVLVFYHPHCPCTRATAKNLESLLSNCDRTPEVIAFAFCPADEDDSWTRSPVTNRLMGIGASIVPDKEGEVCLQFGVNTSGHILVYDGDVLEFSGGITSSRGHEGASPVLAKVADKLNGKSGKLEEWPVFGCVIQSAGRTHE